MTQVFGEETLPIPFDKGLFLHEDYAAIPDGYNIVQKNWFRTRTNKLRLRWGFKKAMSSYTATQADEDAKFIRKVEPYAPDYPYAYIRRAHSAFKPSIAVPGSPTTYTDFPGVIIPFIRSSGATNIAELYCISTSQISADIEMLHTASYDIYWSGFCQYKDRYYMCGRTNEWGTGTGIVAYGSGWAFTGSPAVTFTSVASLSLEGIVTFRDRIFGWADDKIYYTDVAGVGLYPETWGANNVIQIQSSEDGCIIHNVIPLNDKLYIFTDKGLYQLYAVGGTAGWNLQTISKDYKVFGRLGATLVKDTIVFTDRRTLYLLTSGGDISIFGQEIQKKIDLATSVCIVPFEDGIIVSCYNMIALPTAASYTGVTYTYNKWELFITNHYYFDGEIWAELTLPLDGVHTSTFVIAAGYTGKVTHANDGLPSSYLVGHVGTTAEWFTIYYTADHKHADEEPLQAYDAVATLIAIPGQLETKWYDVLPKYIRTKYSYWRYHGKVVTISSIGFKADTAAHYENSVTVVANVNERNSSMLRIKAPQVSKFINAILNVNSKTTGVTTTDDQFILDSISLVVHTENRDVIDKTTP